TSPAATTPSMRRQQRLRTVAPCRLRCDVLPDVREHHVEARIPVAVLGVRQVAAVRARGIAAIQATAQPVMPVRADGEQPRTAAAAFGGAVEPADAMVVGIAARGNLLA